MTNFTCLDSSTVTQVIHFRHLMGDQSIRITKAIVDQLKDPVPFILVGFTIPEETY